MSYSASLESVARDPPTYVLRIHAAGGVFGSPYYGAATVSVIDGVATIRGLAMHRAEYDKEVRLAVETALAAIGCVSMTWTRFQRGRSWRVSRPVRAQP